MRRQDMTWFNVNLLSVGLKENTSRHLNKNAIITQENVFENTVSKC